MSDQPASSRSGHIAKKSDADRLNALKHGEVGLNDSGYLSTSASPGASSTPPRPRPPIHLDYLNSKKFKCLRYSSCILPKEDKEFSTDWDLRQHMLDHHLSDEERQKYDRKNGKCRKCGEEIYGWTSGQILEHLALAGDCGPEPQLQISGNGGSSTSDLESEKKDSDTNNNGVVPGEVESTAEPDSPNLEVESLNLLDDSSDSVIFLGEERVSDNVNDSVQILEESPKESQESCELLSHVVVVGSGPGARELPLPPKDVRRRKNKSKKRGGKSPAEDILEPPETSTQGSDCQLIGHSTTLRTTGFGETTQPPEVSSSENDSRGNVNAGPICSSKAQKSWNVGGKALGKCPLEDSDNEDNNSSILLADDEDDSDDGDSDDEMPRSTRRRKVPVSSLPVTIQEQTDDVSAQIHLPHDDGDVQFENTPPPSPVPREWMDEDDEVPVPPPDAPASIQLVEEWIDRLLMSDEESFEQETDPSIPIDNLSGPESQESSTIPLENGQNDGCGTSEKSATESGIDTPEVPRSSTSVLVLSGNSISNSENASSIPQNNNEADNSRNALSPFQPQQNISNEENPQTSGQDSTPSPPADNGSKSPEALPIPIEDGGEQPEKTAQSGHIYSDETPCSSRSLLHSNNSANSAAAPANSNSKTNATHPSSQQKDSTPDTAPTPEELEEFEVAMNFKDDLDFDILMALHKMITEGSAYVDSDEGVDISGYYDNVAEAEDKEEGGNPPEVQLFEVVDPEVMETEPTPMDENDETNPNVPQNTNPDAEIGKESTVSQNGNPGAEMEMDPNGPQIPPALAVAVASASSIVLTAPDFDSSGESSCSYYDVEASDVEDLALDEDVDMNMNPPPYGLSDRLQFCPFPTCQRDFRNASLREALKHIELDHKYHMCLFCFALIDKSKFGPAVSNHYKAAGHSIDGWLARCPVPDCKEGKEFNIAMELKFHLFTKHFRDP